jgi:glycosyltransferase involved in cell wall biosynthesis
MAPSHCILFLGQDLQTPSFRHRAQSLFPLLAERGWTVREEQLPRGRYGIRIWERRTLLSSVDVVFLAQFKLSGPEARLLRHFVAHVIFDVDDAIYVRQPRGVADPPHDSYWRRRKFAATCKLSDCVVAGNRVLAAVAARSARDVVVLPTPVDPGRYRASTPDPRRPPTIVWIGRPENLKYLELLHSALVRLAARFPALRLRVVCSSFPPWHDVAIDAVPWSTETEVSALADADIGIMPLTRDEWTEGKCAFKLLQYMAASLPCVASPVGANRDAVIDGQTGLLAASDADWEAALARLIESPSLRVAFGAAGRRHLETHYALDGYVRRYADLMTRIAGE